MSSIGAYKWIYILELCCAAAACVYATFEKKVSNAIAIVALFLPVVSTCKINKSKNNLLCHEVHGKIENNKKNMHIIQTQK